MTRQSGSLLLDANLLILLLIGATNAARISRYKRTQKYTQSDYALLLRLVNRFTHLTTTPHILTETSDLVALGGAEMQRFLSIFRIWVENAAERVTPSRELTARRTFSRMGLADLALEEAAAAGITVITDDIHLWLALAEAELPVINFNHLRSAHLV